MAIGNTSFKKSSAEYRYHYYRLRDQQDAEVEYEVSGEEEPYKMRLEMQELVSKDRSGKRKLWLIIGFVTTICLVVAIAAIVLTTRSGPKTASTYQHHGRPAINLDDFIEGRLISTPFNASWVSDTELLYRDRSENIVLYNVVSKHIKVLLTAGQIPQSTFDYDLSADRKYMLLGHNYQKLYSRYSYVAQYTVAELATGKRWALTVLKNEHVFQLARWGPAGSAIICVYDNNIYYRPSAVVPSEIQVTTDGALGLIYNGVSDWVYEEEVLSTFKSLWTSPGGKKLAWLQLNDSQVGVMDIPVYGQAGIPEFQYTKTVHLRYPKAGTPNPTATLMTIDLDSLSSFRLLPVPLTISTPTTLGDEPICSAVAWANDDIVVSIWLNRIQNQAEIISCDGGSVKCDTIISVQDLDGWVDLFSPPTFNKNGSQMLLIMSHDQGNGLGGFRHVTLINNKPHSKMIPLSYGNFVVTEILEWDDKNQIVYFLGTSPNNSAARHLYTVSSDLTLGKPKITCLTCNVKSDNFNRNCLYNSAIFSTNLSHYVLSCDGPTVPEMSIYDKSGKKLEIWEKNEELVELVTEKSTPDIRKIDVPIANGYSAKVMLQIPPDIDITGDTKYPLLINVYGGPDSFSVVEKFNLGWFSYLVTNKSVVVASIDGRGSGLRGDKVSFAGFKQLGTVEVFDQINVTKYLQNFYPFIDAKRTAIWGWSYGGYVSGMALAMDDEHVFNCAISVAPVTDWTLYDSIYVERFMGIPSLETSSAYKRASLLNKLEKFRNKKYLLIHGTLDDNVHFQQSMLLAKGLEFNDIQFRQQTYPDEDHSLSSVRKHLYHTFENFLDECFDPENES